MLSETNFNLFIYLYFLVVPDSPHKIFIGGLPNYLNEDQVCVSNLLISVSAILLGSQKKTSATRSKKHNFHSHLFYSKFSSFFTTRLGLKKSNQYVQAIRVFFRVKWASWKFLQIFCQIRGGCSIVFFIFILLQLFSIKVSSRYFKQTSFPAC